MAGRDAMRLMQSAKKAAHLSKKKASPRKAPRKGAKFELEIDSRLKRVRLRGKELSDDINDLLARLA